MSWLPGMVFMHMLDDDEHDLLQDPPDPVEQYSTRCDAEDAPVVAEVHPPVIDGTPRQQQQQQQQQQHPAHTHRRNTHMAPHCHVSRYIHTIGMPWLHCH